MECVCNEFLHPCCIECLHPGFPHDFQWETFRKILHKKDIFIWSFSEISERLLQFGHNFDVLLRTFSSIALSILVFFSVSETDLRAMLASLCFSFSYIWFFWFFSSLMPFFAYSKIFTSTAFENLTSGNLHSEVQPSFKFCNNLLNGKIKATRTDMHEVCNFDATSAVYILPCFCSLSVPIRISPLQWWRKWALSGSPLVAPHGFSWALAAPSRHP